ncbi:hypothetical protein AGMMS4957_13220 [Bacteroidia bacterium]|nr:hypothetical protein AGMMS4957_13220 [Bacteroidia bacterium]
MAAEDDSLKIQLGIYGKHFTYACKRTEEGIVRRSARLFDGKCLEYSTLYADAKLAEENLLRVTGFHYSLLAETEKEKNEKLFPSVISKVHHLNITLETFLKENQQKTE